MRYEHWSFRVRYEQETRGYSDPYHPAGYYAEFDKDLKHPGWDAILGWVSSEGWELVTVTPCIWSRPKEGSLRESVDLYFVFCKRPE